MFKNRILLLVSFLCLSILVHAQNRDTEKRTTATRIADLLAVMPAANAAQMDVLMLEMSSLGESDLTGIAAMLVAPGKGNDSQVRFAINGFSIYVMGEGKVNSRRLCAGAWCKALGQAGDKEIKAFLISQLQVMGTEESVPCLIPYLSDERLCDPAARAMVVIHSPGAAEALLTALNAVQGKLKVSLAQALGDIRNVRAVQSLTNLVNSNDLNLKKASLYALANIGAGQSGPLLYAEAKKAGFGYENSRAAGAYLLWLDRTGENGNIALVKKQAELVMKEGLAKNQVQSVTEALSLLVKYTGEKSLPKLLAAADVPGMEYRNAALKLTNQLTGEKVTAAWIKKAGKLNDVARADVITMLGNRGDQSALHFITGSLSDPSKPVRLAAIGSAQKLGEEKALSYLLDFMNRADADEIKTAQQALLAMHGENVVTQIGAALPQMTSTSKIALIEVLAARRASEYLGLIQEQMNTGDAAVKSAGIKALASLVNEKDLPGLFKLLTEANRPEDIKGIQMAVLSALRGIEPNDRKSEIVIKESGQVPPGKQSRFYGILSEIGGHKALSMVVKAFAEGTGENRTDAFRALAGWNDAEACGELLHVITGNSGEAYADTALSAYVRLVSGSGFPADQQLLMLRKAMDAATSVNQKILVLDALRNVKTFTALVFSGRFMDDPQLKSRAANTVMQIALADTSLAGDITGGLLNKAMGLLQGSESDYNREAIRKYLSSKSAGPGFVPLFNGRDLTGWKGLVDNPVLRAKMKPADLVKKQSTADEVMRKGWNVQNGVLMFTGTGENLCTTKPYGDFEMLVDWKIMPGGDAGIYLRGSPQVQIWDASQQETDAKVGSGGLYNNMIYEKNPLVVADNPVGDWNTFRIKMTGERVTVYLNGKLVVDNTILENYWDRSIPIFPSEQIELQAHGSLLGYRDIYIREIPRSEPYQVSAGEKSAGFTELFDGMSLINWTGNTKDYLVEDGNIVFHPNNGGSGNLYTRGEYGDFTLRFDFQLTPAGNSGIGIRAPLGGDAAYVGMEIQVLDDEADVYKNLQPYQFHGSVYGVIPAKRGYLKPVGEWNSEEIMIRGNKIRVTLNDTVIVDGDIAEASKNGTMDHKDHPGLKNEKGHIGLLSHDSPVKFRNLRIKTSGTE